MRKRQTQKDGYHMVTVDINVYSGGSREPKSEVKARRKAPIDESAQKAANLAIIQARIDSGYYEHVIINPADPH